MNEREKWIARQAMLLYAAGTDYVTDSNLQDLERRIAGTTQPHDSNAHELQLLRQAHTDLEKLLRDLVVECEEGDWTDGTDIRSEDDRAIEETEAFKAARAAVPEVQA